MQRKKTENKNLVIGIPQYRHQGEILKLGTCENCNFRKLWNTQIVHPLTAIVSIIFDFLLIPSFS